MTIANKIKDLLEREHLSYQVLEHNPAFTALETAQAQHIPGRQMVKVVVVNADGKLVMCVLSAVQKIDFSKLSNVLKAKDVQLADEKKVSTLFPDYDVGAEPPFAEGTGLKIYVDKMLEENDSIVFNAGTHTDLVKVKFKDYVRLAKPIFADFGFHVV